MNQQNLLIYLKISFFFEFFVNTEIDHTFVYGIRFESNSFFKLY